MFCFWWLDPNPFTLPTHLVQPPFPPPLPGYSATESPCRPSGVHLRQFL